VEAWRIIIALAAFALLNRMLRGNVYRRETGR